MESDYYDIAYVGSNRIFVFGFDRDKEHVVELNPAQIELVYDFNARQETKRKAFLRGFIQHGG